MGLIKVVCGVIYKDNKILLCRRKPGKFLEGYWEFPGGKVEDYETNENSLIRELQEELEMEVKIESFFTISEHHYEKFSIELIVYKCIYKTSNFKLTDHDKYEWVKPNDLLNWKLAPADIPIAKKLIS
ncbi:(deoxy)nucleoside triphosphate pyrophosphohydrolase [Aestuariivivens sp. NBU2969]|uniref:(deoxy)nucleoside triphosphate pyrophosphohydrolase n=1 Tax=Aestuariivivens sp. NBU2969 TaxID=2873267 RepID=UPI001CBAA6BF|nr:(deoxy)nucleoside triphosphate pyrophosphohydrolase [Aestuariivivens sp. NBU2969]